MSTLSIIEQVKALAAQYASVIAMAELLESIGSIEQATMEANTAAQQAMNQRDASVLELARINALIEAASAELATSKQQASQMTSEAIADANTIRLTARSDADRILDIAKGDADKMQVERDALNAEADSLSRFVAEKQDELNSVTQKIADAKAAMIASLG